MNYMPQYGYSIIGLDPDKTAKASGREVRISPKAAREVCQELRGLRLEAAKSYLGEVIALRKAVPYRRHDRKVAHRKGLHKADSGRFPVKASQVILKVLENAENNADFKGLDLERLRITHISAYPGRVLRRIIERSHGRATAYDEQLVHIEVVLTEEG
jgi:large subunit ribosomal protein L22